MSDAVLKTREYHIWRSIFDFNWLIKHYSSPAFVAPNGSIIEESYRTSIRSPFDVEQTGNFQFHRNSNGFFTEFAWIIFKIPSNENHVPFSCEFKTSKLTQTLNLRCRKIPLGFRLICLNFVSISAYYCSQTLWRIGLKKWLLSHRMKLMKVGLMNEEGRKSKPWALKIIMTKMDSTKSSKYKMKKKHEAWNVKMFTFLNAVTFSIPELRSMKWAN